MSDIAAAAGVSRQTLYKEFGNRDEFGLAFVIHEGERFLDDVEAAVREHLDDPRAAVGAALELFLRTAGEDPLIRILLSDDGTGGMLPFVTTQGMPVVQWATARLGATIEEGWPQAPKADVALLAESLVRLAISYITGPSELAGDDRRRRSPTCSARSSTRRSAASTAPERSTGAAARPQRRRALDQVGGALGDRDRRGVGVAARDGRHHRGVDDADALEALDPQLGVDDRADRAGADRVVDREGGARRRGRAASSSESPAGDRERLGAVGRASPAGAQISCASRSAAIIRAMSSLGAVEVVADDRLRGRVVGGEPDRAAALAASAGRGRPRRRAPAGRPSPRRRSGAGRRGTGCRAPRRRRRPGRSRRPRRGWRRTGPVCEASNSSSAAGSSASSRLSGSGVVQTS